MSPAACDFMHISSRLLFRRTARALFNHFRDSKSWIVGMAGDCFGVAPIRSTPPVHVLTLSSNMFLHNKKKVNCVRGRFPPTSHYHMEPVKMHILRQTCPHAFFNFYNKQLLQQKQQQNYNSSSCG